MEKGVFDLFKMKLFKFKYFIHVLNQFLLLILIFFSTLYFISFKYFNGKKFFDKAYGKSLKKSGIILNETTLIFDNGY